MKDYDIIVLSGGFDPPHVGHARMIRAASELADLVFVGVNSDAWLSRKKGYVFMPWTERAEMIQSLKGTTEAMAFDDADNTAGDIIRKIRKQYPDQKIAFGNGGDRVRENTPEMKTCFVERVDMIWGVGGEEKVQSSSDLVRHAQK